MPHSESANPLDLARASREQQLETMIDWFRERFEDPVHSRGYSSSEGGYFWNPGEPYDAHDELSNDFSGIVADDVIEEASTALSSECTDWARKSDYEDDLFETISSNSDAFVTLQRALETIERLSDVGVDGSVLETQRRLLFANAITALETFLSDTFINQVIPRRDLVQRYIESDPDFRERKVLYKDLLKESLRLIDEVKDKLLNTVWHNLGRIKPLYSAVLGIDIGDIGSLSKAVQARHDIVHRNGRRKDGSELSVTREQIEDLLQDIRALARVIELGIPAVPRSIPPHDAPIEPWELD